ncbi:MAG: DUF2510 domain-containing protein [Nocardioides sp.]|uniref:DUF2510 domain-containing protein n=1 Tax=Nocardioides sp. TaxID=35761 RepID=UPI0039E38663
MTTPPGWYPTPDGVAERWHDGTRWTGVTRPGQGGRPAPGTLTAPAGWYATPGGDQERWFDGERWTKYANDRMRLAAGHDTTGGGRGSRRPRRQRNAARPRRGRVFKRVVIVAVILALVAAGAVAVLAFAPGDAGHAFRQVTGIRQPQRVLAEVTPAVASNDYRFLAEDDAGAPTRYDPCRTIGYVINPDGAPANYEQFIHSAVAAAQTASGLQFQYGGLVADTWESRRSGQDERPVLITFATAAQVRQLGEREFDKDVAGVGGSLEVIEPDGDTRYVTGAIALSGRAFAAMSAAGRVDEERAIVMHELGHVLGLDHVASPDELMFADNVGKKSYGAGDLAGLAVAGAGTCR